MTAEHQPGCAQETNLDFFLTLKIYDMGNPEYQKYVYVWSFYKRLTAQTMIDSNHGHPGTEWFLPSSDPVTDHLIVGFSIHLAQS